VSKIDPLGGGAGGRQCERQEGKEVESVHGGSAVWVMLHFAAIRAFRQVSFPGSRGFC
jgi:hypothetical protein